MEKNKITAQKGGIMACTIKISVCGEDITCKEPFKVASDKVAILFAKFTIKGCWEYPVIKAIFVNDEGVSVSKVLNDNQCEIPPEVLLDKGEVRVGLVATESENSTIVKQMTSHTALVVTVDEKVRTDAENSINPTASEFDQFVEIVKEDADRAEEARDQAEEYAESASESAQNAETYKDSALQSSISAHASEVNASDSADEAHTSEVNAKISEDNAKESEDNAKASEDNAKDSEDNAKAYSESAEESKDLAKQSEDNAKESEDNAKISEDNASESATNAHASEVNAGTSETNAHTSEVNAQQSATASANSAQASADSADEASGYADDAEASAQEIENLTVSIEMLPEGSQAVVVKTGGSGTPYNLLFKMPVGDTGNGIQSATLNSDYTLTLVFTNGTSYTTPSIRGGQGEKGEKGDDGVLQGGTAFSFRVNDDGNLILSATEETLEEYEFEIVNGDLIMRYEEV